MNEGEAHEENEEEEEEEEERQLEGLVYLEV